MLVNSSGVVTAETTPGGLPDFGLITGFVFPTNKLAGEFG